MNPPAGSGPAAFPLPPDTMPSGLPPVDADSAAHSRDMEAHLLQRIAMAPGGFLPFEQWMAQALYAPGLGYYAAGNTKFGASLPAGDFTTAPEMTPVFGEVLARQVAHVLQMTGTDAVLEFGAGTGALAASLIPALQELGIDVKYHILEVSADLAERQAQRLAPWASAVQWLDALPTAFKGCVIANEVLDAMPAALFRWNETGELMELGVQARPGETPPFSWAERPAGAELSAAIGQRMPALPGYRSEINLQAEAWMRQLGSWLEAGVALLIDYGFPQREYYHPQRITGTLMCHFRHHSHDQALVLAGIQDITAHVDFTAMADAALEGGLDVLGYTNQARFLLNAGLPEVLQNHMNAPDSTARQATLSAVQKLVSEAEMGELFKVLAVGRGVEPPLTGFLRGDKRDTL
ncbi:MAG: class I SAM-dependent methyltransferase [Alcaligenaceae bacterium]|nr:class I SAM-dependent methyltransferase [Alcaligenaceae bacterium]